MMEDPGCKAGRLISKIPVRGPEARKMRSLLIFESVIAKFLIADYYITKP